ncbi:type II toxin-antitoxin system RelE family toxin [Nostoc sp.]|uniref:type II toxin-antitoxin system RelE family toxin n=1 Tax=Nostoc sp. TaxID=1180 RepID=UPI002FFCE313
MWKVEYTKKFLKELADLPQDVQARIEPIVFQELESENPFDLGYLQKMTPFGVRGVFGFKLTYILLMKIPDKVINKNKFKFGVKKIKPNFYYDFFFPLYPSI